MKNCDVAGQLDPGRRKGEKLSGPFGASPFALCESARAVALSSPPGARESRVQSPNTLPPLELKRAPSNFPSSHWSNDHQPRILPGPCAETGGRRRGESACFSVDWLAGRSLESWNGLRKSLAWLSRTSGYRSHDSYSQSQPLNWSTGAYSLIRLCRSQLQLQPQPHPKNPRPSKGQTTSRLSSLSLSPHW